MQPAPLTGNERFFNEDEIIVSKTNTKGIITYANQVFLRVAGYAEKELLGAPHNIIRHPDMPRCVFKLLWDTIMAGEEIFAYVLNRAKNGDHYWVLAHVTPSFDSHGHIIGYHSNRRVPGREQVEKAFGLYQTLNEIERRAATPSAGMAASMATLTSQLSTAGITYEQFFFSL